MPNACVYNPLEIIGPSQWMMAAFNYIGCHCFTRAAILPSADLWGSRKTCECTRTFPGLESPGTASIVQSPWASSRSQKWQPCTSQMPIWFQYINKFNNSWINQSVAYHNTDRIIFENRVQDAWNWTEAALRALADLVAQYFPVAILSQLPKKH